MDVTKEAYDMVKLIEEHHDIKAVEMLQNKSISVNDLIDFSEVIREYGYEPRFDFHVINDKREIMVHLQKTE